LILEKLPATLLLVFSSQILAISLGMILGVIAARKPNGLASLVVTFLSLFGFAAPVFWSGILLIILFVSIFPIFPVGGMSNVTVEGGFFVKSLDILYHLILPMVTLASIYIALYSRLVRASMLEVLGSDYIRTARAKGLSENIVLYKHALKNALGPLITVAGLQFWHLVLFLIGGDCDQYLNRCSFAVDRPTHQVRIVRSCLILQTRKLKPFILCQK